MSGRTGKVFFIQHGSRQAVGAQKTNPFDQAFTAIKGVCSKVDVGNDLSAETIANRQLTREHDFRPIDNVGFIVNTHVINKGSPYTKS